MLRGEIDFLYDVGPDALDFVEQSPTTFVATFLRPYATAMVFNMAHPTLGRRGVRTALNVGVDRAEIIRDSAERPRTSGRVITSGRSTGPTTSDAAALRARSGPRAGAPRRRGPAGDGLRAGAVPARGSRSRASCRRRSAHRARGAHRPAPADRDRRGHASRVGAAARVQPARGREPARCVHVRAAIRTRPQPHRTWSGTRRQVRRS